MAWAKILYLIKFSSVQFSSVHDTRNSSSVLEFKNRIKSQVTNKRTNYTIPTERANKISLTRIKYNCSSLNAELNKVNSVPSALCSYGTTNETVQRYFFDCNLFIVPRNCLLASLPAVPFILDTLLYCHDLLTFETTRSSIRQFYNL